MEDSDRQTASLTATIAEYAAGLRFPDLPANVVIAAKQGILDWVGVAFAGSQEPVAEVVHRFLGRVGGGAGASVVGYPGLVAAPFAALANGTIGHALDLDDTHLAAKLHTTAVVLPAVLAIADTSRLSGSDLIAAYVAGFEAATGLGQAIGPDHYEAGWHATGTMGTFGAAVAASRALGLSAEEIARAVSLAGTQAAGLQRVFGTMAKPFNAGRAAMSGCLAALLASEGLTAPDDVLGGGRGVLGLLGGEASPQFAGSPGGPRHILGNTVKLYACCHALHAAIEVALRLRSQLDANWESVARVDVSGWPITANIAAIPNPKTGYEAKFSVFFAVAAALVDGSAGLGEFTPDKVADQRIRRLAEKVRFTPDPSLDITSAVIEVTFADGRRIRGSTNSIQGAVGLAEAWPAVERKFLECTAPVVGEPAARAIAGRIKALHTCEQVAPFWGTIAGSTCVPQPPTPRL